MKWEEFLMPDWRKIALFIILTIAIFSITYSLIRVYIESSKMLWGISLEEDICWKSSIDCREGNETCSPAYKNLLDLTCNQRRERQNCEGRLLDITLDIYILLPTIFVSYIFSCIIVWIYDKARKK